MADGLQLLEYFSGNLKASPESLGDPQREASEDIQERYERVMASTLSAMSALLIDYSSGRAQPFPRLQRCYLSCKD